MSFRPITSACGTSTYKLSKFLTRILQRYKGKNFCFVKDSKGLADSLKGKSLNPDETLVSFEGNALFTNISVPVALDVINRKLTVHISHEGLQDFLEHSHSIPKDKIIPLLEPILNNCVSLPTQVLQTTPGSSYGFSSFPTHSKYLHRIFWGTGTGTLMPIPTPWWKRYVDDIICITKKDQMDILFNHINQMDAHIKFTMKCLYSEGSILSWTLCAPLTPTILSITQCIENLCIQTDIWTGIQTIPYLQKDLSYKHSPVRLKWYAPPQRY